MKIDLLLQIQALYRHVGNIKEPQEEVVGVFHGFKKKNPGFTFLIVSRLTITLL